MAKIAKSRPARRTKASSGKRRKAKTSKRRQPRAKTKTPSPLTPLPQAEGKRADTRATKTTARGSKKVAPRNQGARPPGNQAGERQDISAQPASPPPDDTAEVQDDQHDVLDDSDMQAITAEMCREIENAVLLINCLMPLKRMAHVIDACACPYDPKDNPPDWCLIIHGRMWQQLENVITRINDAIGLRMKRVTEIIGAKHLTEEQWRRT